MDKRYIDPIKLKMSIALNTNKTLEDIIDDEPAAEVVSRGLFEQYKWERDVAIEQLEKLGISLGQKIDGVYLTKEEYDKLFECVDKRYKYGKNLFINTQFR